MLEIGLDSEEAGAAIERAQVARLFVMSHGKAEKVTAVTWPVPFFPIRETPE